MVKATRAVVFGVAADRMPSPLRRQAGGHRGPGSFREDQSGVRTRKNSNPLSKRSPMPAEARMQSIEIKGLARPLRIDTHRIDAPDDSHRSGVFRLPGLQATRKCAGSADRAGRGMIAIGDRVGVLGRGPGFGRAVALAALLVAGMWLAPGAAGADEPPSCQGPCALAVARDGHTLFVACGDARQVAFVALPCGKVERRVPLPAAPTGLALTPDGKRLLVSCAAPRSTAVVLDATSGERLGAIRVGHTAAAVALGPAGRRAYVCNRFDHDVSVIDLEAGGEIARVPAVREPVAVALTPDGCTLLVANHLPLARTHNTYLGEVAPVVTAVDTRTLKTTPIALPHGANGLREVCVMPDGRHALVTHLLSNFEEVPFRVDMGWINTNVVSLIDLARREVIGTIGMDEMDRGAGNPWGVVCSGDGGMVCVGLSGTHELCLIKRSVLLSDEARRTMQPMMGVWPIYVSLGETSWRRAKLPGKGPRGMAAAGTRVYVAEYFSDTVAVFDLAAPEGERVGTIALGPRPRLTPERRGELLFHDATICYQNWQSCASCHPEGRADGLNWDLMNDGYGNFKSTKSMILAHATPPAMAEGVRATAEVAVRSGLDHILFANRPEDEAEAIDAYLKALEPVPSPHLVDGRLSPAAERGRKLFHSDRIACHRCHPPPRFTDMRSHDVGTQRRDERTGRFDTPTLVEVWRTAPYLHDGRYLTVREVLAEGRHGLVRDANLSDEEIDALAEYVLSL